jgi:hypothetical protein
MHKTIPKVICNSHLGSNWKVVPYLINIFFLLFQLQITLGRSIVYVKKTGLLNKHTSSGRTVSLPISTLLLDLPSESEGENLVHFIQCHCPLNIKAKLPKAGNFSLKQRVSTSTLMNFTLKV